MDPTSEDRDGQGSSERSEERSSHSSRSRSESAFSKEFSQAIGHTIKVLRTDLGIARKELAETVGISYSYLTEIENGNKPASSNVLRPIAHALNMRLSQLTEAAERRIEAGDQPTMYQMAPPDDLSSSPSRARSVSLLDEASPLEDAPPRYALEVDANVARASIADDPEAARAAREYDLLQSRASMRPSMRGQYHEIRAALLELERLVDRMAPDDIERLLDYARRLSR